MSNTRTMPRWVLKAAISTAVAVALVGGFVAVTLNAEYRVKSTTLTLFDTARHYPSAKAFRISTSRGEVYECVLPEPLGVLPSGRPACTFDAKGQRVQWTSDDGDSADYVKGVRSGVRTAVELEVITREAGGATKNDGSGRSEEEGKGKRGGEVSSLLPSQSHVGDVPSR